MMHTRTATITVALLMVWIGAGCGIKDQRVGLAYDTITGAEGGGGELFLAEPPEKYAADKTPGGLLILGKVNGTEGDVVTGDDTDDWFLRALEKELSAAGYRVKTVIRLPNDAPRGLKPSLVKISADQTLSLIKAATVVRLKVSVQVWKKGKHVQTVSVSAGNEDEGIDHSAGHISSLLMNTLQNGMRNIVPDLIEALEK